MTVTTKTDTASIRRHQFAAALLLTLVLASLQTAPLFSPLFVLQWSVPTYLLLGAPLFLFTLRADPNAKPTDFLGAAVPERQGQ